MQRPVFIHPGLLEATHVFLRRDMLRRPLQQPYDGPFKVLQRKDKVFSLTSMVNGYLYLLIDANLLFFLNTEDLQLPQTKNETPATVEPNATTPTPATVEHDPTASTPTQPSTRSGRIVHLPTRRHLDAFTRGRIIGKLEEGRSVTSVAAEFELLTASFHDFGRQFQTTETAIRGSVVVVHEEPHPQMTGTLSYRTEETGGRKREKSLDTTQATDDRYRVLPWREDCTVVVCLHDALYDESRFSLSSDSHRILIWRERKSRNHPSNIIERVRYGGRSVLVWGGIMLGSRTDLHISTQVQSTGPVIVTRFFFHMCVFLEALWVCSSFHGRQCTMSLHSSCRTALERVRILNVWIGRHAISGSQSHRACMGFSRQTLGSSYLTTSNDSGASIGTARRMGSNASTTH
ncbi:transposable element Tcb1 transposase [Trichonephila clavipes]|nr:transposable element Tcb1 transposase [Trichonephila clavipes]